MMLRPALFLCLACGLAAAADRQASGQFLSKPGLSVPDASAQALSTAIRGAIQPDILKEQVRRGWPLLGPNALAMQMGPRVPAVCSIPLLEVHPRSDTNFVIGKIAPGPEFDKMPKVELPAPPCGHSDSRRK